MDTKAGQGDCRGDDGRPVLSTAETKRLPLERRLVCVEYPGNVKSVDRAIETLGGWERAGRQLQAQADTIDLTYQPNTYHRVPMTAQRSTTTQLLLRVRRRKSTANHSTAAVTADIVGVISAIYRFQGLADFQCLSPPEFTIPKEPTSLADFPSRFQFRSEPLYLPPPLFSRVNRAMDYMFRQNTTSNRTGLAAQLQAIGGDSLPANKKTETRLALPHSRRRGWEKMAVRIDYAGKTPASPKSLSVKVAEQYANEMVQLRELFTKRAIWSRMALHNNLPKAVHRSLKYVLPAVAYTFAHGPWRMLWVKFGYDPRDDPLSKIYQMIDIRLPSVALGRASGSYAAQGDVGETSSQHNSRNFSLSRTNLPAQRQSFYQLCDLHDMRLQAIINKGTAAVCGEVDGWCLPGTYAELRIAVKDLVKRAKEGIPDVVDDITDTAGQLEAGRMLASLISSNVPVSTEGAPEGQVDIIKLLQNTEYAGEDYALFESEEEPGGGSEDDEGESESEDGGID